MKTRMPGGRRKPLHGLSWGKTDPGPALDAPELTALPVQFTAVWASADCLWSLFARRTR